MAIQRNAEVLIPVTTLAGSCFAVRLRPDATLATMEEQVSREMAVDPRRLALFFEGRQINNGDAITLQDAVQQTQPVPFHLASFGWDPRHCITAVATSLPPRCPHCRRTLAQSERFTRFIEEASMLTQECLHCGVNCGGTGCNRTEDYALPL